MRSVTVIGEATPLDGVQFRLELVPFKDHQDRQRIEGRIVLHMIHKDVVLLSIIGGEQGEVREALATRLDELAARVRAV